MSVNVKTLQKWCLCVHVYVYVCVCACMCVQPLPFHRQKDNNSHVPPQQLH